MLPDAGDALTAPFDHLLSACGIETTGYVFGDLDHLARAKLALVFGLHLVALLVLFRCTAA